MIDSSDTLFVSQKQMWKCAHAGERSVAQQSRFFCHILLVIMPQSIFKRRQVWTAQRPVYYRRSLAAKPCCCNSAVCGLALSYWNKRGMSLKKDVAWMDGSTCCPKACIYLSVLMVPSQQGHMIPWTLMRIHSFTCAGSGNRALKTTWSD